ncbi:hypothetical protein POTOM_050218 [Populus tomentosa]|uniref:N-acetylglucosaminylphosphatidylinositol deacetylase n=1 Tax=Populus tomentosa TaxID=118781 RepID=A0A8X8C936_POPTO|nr:hypothetical protein POTOM_050218 [Populus tomentosa]
MSVSLFPLPAEDRYVLISWWIITFDNYGVSGHCNHRDVRYGLNEHPQKSFHAMAEHSSQWVWYACCHKLLKWN